MLLDENSPYVYLLQTVIIGLVVYYLNNIRGCALRSVNNGAVLTSIGIKTVGRNS